MTSPDEVAAAVDKLRRLLAAAPPGSLSLDEIRSVEALVTRKLVLSGQRPEPIPWAYPSAWELCRAMAPEHVSKPFSAEHDAIWDWAWDIRPGIAPRPLCVALPRGRGKSTTLALVAVALAAHRRRRYCLIVSGTQKQADAQLRTIAGILESPTVQRLWPELGRPKLTRHAQSVSWTQQKLVTDLGCVFESVGLVESIRGLRYEDQRPDLIIGDDLGGWLDSEETIRKMLDALSGAVLPAGSGDAAVCVVGNIPHPRGVMAHIVNPAAFPEDERILLDRVLVGPTPAVEDLHVEFVENDEGVPLPRITSGRATWVGQPIEWCEAQIRTLGLLSFLREMQHEQVDPLGGLYDHVKWRYCDWEEIPWPSIVDIQVWVDPAVTDKDTSDCQAFQADAVANDGTVYRLHSWEQRTSPRKALREALLVAAKLGASTVGIETDQGGMTWEDVYANACAELETEGALKRRPKLAYEKAGSWGSKVERQQLQLHDYELGRIVHVRTATIGELEKSLRRFPRRKPYDLADASAWSHKALRDLVPITDVAEDLGVGEGNEWDLDALRPTDPLVTYDRIPGIDQLGTGWLDESIGPPSEWR